MNDFSGFFMRDAAELMKAAGWITHFHPTPNGLVMAWTAKGRAAALQMEQLMNDLYPDGGSVEAETLNCVFVLASLSEDGRGESADSGNG